MATTVLWAGGEDLDFSKIGAITFDQTSGHFRGAPYSRGAIVVPITVGTGVSVANISNAVAFTAASSLWFHGQHYASASGPNNVDTAIAFADSSGNQRFQIGWTNDASNIPILYKQDGAGHQTTLATAVFNVTVNALLPVDIAITISSTNGSFALYQNMALIVGYSGNTLTDNQTTLSTVLLNGFAGYVGANYWSECIVANNDTRSLSLCTGIASGLGNTNTWTVNGGSSAWQNVSQWVTSNNINIAVATSSQLAEFTVSSLASGAWSVTAVVTSAYALAGTSGGPQHLAHVVRTAATDYSGALQTLGASISNSQQVWQTNPSTGGNWQQSDLTNPGFNFGVVSEP